MLKKSPLPNAGWLERILIGLAFTAIGGLIIVVFSPWRPLLEPIPDYLGRIGLIVFLLVTTLLAKRSPRFEKIAPILTGLLIMIVVVSLEWIGAVYLQTFLGEKGDSPIGFALSKLNECALVVTSVILFTRLSGGSLASIYIQKGDLKQGLRTGLIALGICIAGAIPMTTLLFKAGDLSLPRVLPWIPWLLLAALANGTLEELLFRGLFLRRLQPFFGKFMSTFLIALVFTILHKTVGYTLNEMTFLAVVFPLALVWGYLTQKTDSLWAAILFHAGTDLPVFLSIFSSFK